MSFLEDAVIYRIAALVVLPISRRPGCGSVLGYLAAGIIIWLFGFSFDEDVEQ